MANWQSISAFWKPSTKKQLSEVEARLNSGADVNFINFTNRNNTPLHHAVAVQSQDIIGLLLSRGANKTAVNEDGKTPFELQWQPTDAESTLQKPPKLISIDNCTPKTYLKRPGTSAISGQLYETKLLALALFRAVHRKDVTSFYLGTNLDDAGAFDDVVVRYRKDESDHLLFLQAKHKEDCSKKIVLKDLLDSSKLSGNFNLGKYFRSYLQIRYKFSEYSESVIFNGRFESTNIELTIFTPAAIDIELGPTSELKVKIERTNCACLFFTQSHGKTISFEGSLQSFIEIAVQWHFEIMAEIATRQLMYSGNCSAEDIKESIEQLIKDNNSALVKLKSLEEFSSDNFISATVDKSKLKMVQGFLSKSKREALSLKNEEYLALVEDFFRKLKIYTEQSTEAVVEQIVLDEIRQKYGKSVNDSLIFLKYHDAVQQWWKQTGDVPFRSKNCQLFKNALDEVETGSVLQNVHDICMSRVKIFEVTFKVVQYEEITKFMNSLGKGRFNLFGEHLGLNSIRLVQLFESNNWEFKIIDIDHIGIDHLERAIERQASCLILVFEGHLNDKLLSTLENNVEKIVFLTETEFKGQWESKELKCNGLMDLTDDSHQKILKRTIYFQDLPLQLGSALRDETSLVDSKTLWQLVQGKRIDIDPPKSPSQHDDGINYYVERTLRLCSLKVELTTDSKKFYIFAERDLLNQSEERDILVISNNSDCGDLKKRFEELCELYPSRNIHLLKEVENLKKSRRFAWLNSQGSLKNLREYTDSSCIEFAPASVINDNELLSSSVVILAADPGMGKTTLLAALASKTKKSHPSEWVVRINLLDHSNQLKRLQNAKVVIEKREASQFLDVILGYTERSSESFEQTLFRKCCDQRQLIMLVDGFDEVSPDYSEVVLKLLGVFRTDFARTLWIATRSGNIQYELEEYLGVFAHGLKPFTGDDTKLFLQKYWSAHLRVDRLNEEKFEIFTAKLMKQFAHSLDQRGLEFMSVPLQIKMIAIIFQNDFKAFLESSDYRSFYKKQAMVDLSKDLLEVYETFIEIKFDVLEGEKYQVDTSLPLNRISHKSNFEQFIEKHKLIAVHTLFEQPEVDLLLSPEEQRMVLKHLDVVRKYEEKTGIIYHVIGQKALFVHLTYAEYFAAIFLYEKIEHSSAEGGMFQKLMEDIFVENLIVKNRTQICRFLQLKAKRDITDAAINSIKFRILVERMLDSFEKFQNPASVLMVKLAENYLRFRACSIAAVNIISGKSEGSKMFLLLNGTSEGCVALVRIVIQQVSNVNGTMGQGFFTALHRASTSGNVELVTLLLDHKVDIDACTKDYGFTALHLAAMKGHPEVVTVLLKYRPKLHGLCRLRGHSPLHWASSLGHADIVAMLLKIGVNADALTGGIKETPLHLASRNGRKAVVELLLEHGASVHSRNLDGGSTALHYAAKARHTEIVSMLISKGALVNNGRTDNGCTPLHLAADAGNVETIEALLEAGASVDVCSSDGWTPLVAACFKGHALAVRELLQNGASINAKTTSYGHMGIHMAAQNGHTDVTAVLLENGAQLDAATLDTGATPLFLASSNGHKTVVELLLSKGSRVDAAATGAGWTPLMVASMNGHTEVAELLIQSGANVHGQCNDSEPTPLHLAAQHGHDQTAAMLLGYGAKADAPAGEYGLTALSLAITCNQKVVVETLLKKYPNALVADGYKALQFVIQNENLEMIQILLKNGLDVTASREDDGFTALHVAAQIGNWNAFVMLFDAAKEVDVLTPKDGVTPLLVASGNGHKLIVKTLLQAGCVAGLGTCKIGWTSLHAASLIGSTEIVELLLEYGANIDVATLGEGPVPVLCESSQTLINVFRRIIDNMVHDDQFLENCANQEKLQPVQPISSSPKTLSKIIGYDSFSKTVEAGLTALHLASQMGHIELVELLLANEAQIDAKSINNHTPLYLAISDGHDPVALLLIEREADLACKTHDIGFTPMHIASYRDNIQIASFLEYVGADVDARTTDNGRTPLMIAAEQGHVSIVKLLAMNNANVNACTTDNSSTALHLAAGQGHKDVVSMLLEKGAEKDVVTSDNGLTPLHLACQNGHHEVVLRLVSAGAKVDVISEYGHTPAYLATGKGFFDIVDILRGKN